MAMSWAPLLTGGFASPYAQKLFYFHMPAAMASYVFFISCALGSIAYLRRRDMAWDAVALSGALVALLFCAVTLLTGAIWGLAEWGVAWRLDDVKLNTYMVLFLVLLGYLLLRRSVPVPERRARLSAVYGLLGFVTVPLSYVSMYIFRTYHPIVVSPGGGGVGPEVGAALGVSMLAVLLLGAYLFLLVHDVVALEERVMTLKEAWNE
jgi:heme exporter protein C